MPFGRAITLMLTAWRVSSDLLAKAERKGLTTRSTQTRQTAARRLAQFVRWKEDVMAEYGEWNRKGATLSDVTAKADYGVSQDFIVKGIQTGKLEYRQGSVWGNPYLRVLRSQLEKYIAEECGEDYLLRVKNQTELRRVKKEISDLKKRLEGLQERKNELEALLGK
jgi:hypothetical protein